MRMVFPPATGKLFNDLANDMNVLVESIMGEDSPNGEAYRPAMDIEETADGFEFSLDLPGVAPDDIHIDVDQDRVTIHGTRKSGKDDSADSKRRVERAFGEFRRVFRLPKSVDKDSIEANSEHGVLTLKLPKAAKPEPRRVVVTHGRNAAEPTPESES